MWYFLAAVGGFLLGTVLTCVLLCNKNLEMYKQIEQRASGALSGSMSNGLQSAKALYKAQVEAYENDEPLVASEDESEDEPADDE